MEQTKRICRRCLTKDMNQKEYFQSMYTYIENLEEDIKADQDMYESRIRFCSECKWLYDGMCRACGCFVELRAAVEKNRCPYEKW